MFKQRTSFPSLLAWSSPWLILLIINALLRLANVEAFQIPIVQQKYLRKLQGVMSSDNSGNKEVRPSKKQLILIRHGLSYMNEYIGANGISFGGPGFTDIFNTEDQESCYRDSPLSATGQEQARELCVDIESLLSQETLEDCDKTRQNLQQCLQHLDLVVVSPLTRAIQTAQLALLPHITSSNLAQQRADLVPFVALPLAAERLYLVSDIGTPRSALKRDYGTFVDFETGFPENLPWDQPWWWSLPQSGDNNQTEYEEWRPTGQGQQYLCPGEPYGAFEQRMAELCEWLNKREEATIALVGHFGVFEWLLQDTKTEATKFGNCEIRVVPFEPMLRKAKKTFSRS